MSAPTRPLMRYFGGKWLLAPWIIEHFPPHRVYVEPFGGAASVLLRKDRVQGEVYNDIDGDIVNLFRVLRDPVRSKELRRRLILTPYARVEFQAAYRPSPDPVERARRILIRSWMGFGTNGVFRKTGYRTNEIVNRYSACATNWKDVVDSLPEFIERLRGVNVENVAAVDVIGGHDSEETLFFCDPPYVHSARARADERYRHEMTDREHIELARVLHAVKGMVVISGYPSPLYDELYAGWRRESIETHANRRWGKSPRTEVLWLSPSVSRALDRAREQDTTPYIGLFEAEAVS